MYYTIVSSSVGVAIVRKAEKLVCSRFCRSYVSAVCCDTRPSVFGVLYVLLGFRQVATRVPDQGDERPGRDVDKGPRRQHGHELELEL